ncbi:sensor histidine kinase [Pedobacter namyangjuensis]|uniref:sensor histidine kinase n=1 Tax=Pedobacter namyangjuensis TaxID=600626 RepID=UPI000DE49DF1|nr:histidine kinase N-terminal 7TM domain-containing protein [Pedobacter namyangjuensis]
MEFEFNVYAVFLIVCGCLSIVLANIIYRRGENIVRWFSIMMLANAIWSIGYGLELSSSTLSQIKFLISIEYIGITTLPLLWFIFCLYFCGKEAWIKKKRNILSIAIVPVITMLMVWTNSYHHLYYKSIAVNYAGPFPMADLTRAPWYFVFTLYFYILLACGTFLIVQKFRSSDRIYRNQNYIVIIAAFLPWISNIVYMVGIRPFGFIDLTPFAFMFAIFLIFVGVYRFKLFDIIPIAREKVLELMHDGFIVLDHKNRIIDYNKSLLRYIENLKTSNLVGVNIKEIFPKETLLLKHIENHEPGNFDLSLEIRQEIIYLNVDLIFLNENKISDNFSIIKLQDLTHIKRESILNEKQATELKKLNQQKDRIFSIISHDLRGPLVNLSEVLKMTNDGSISAEEFKSLIPTLGKDIIYTTDLLENLLHWSRSQLKGYGIKKESFNLRNLIINEINYHLPSASAKKINIIHDVFPGEMVYADMLMVQIVIRNILNNAIKFCVEHCEIVITASYQKDHKMLVRIKDNGIGISKNKLKQIFAGDNSTRGTANERGTGLGLMVCKEFMERNNGTIAVESKEGIGSTFSITIPTDENMHPS